MMPDLEVIMDMEIVVDQLREFKGRFEKTERTSSYSEGTRWDSEQAGCGELLAWRDGP
jgi:hypothetical protein